MSSLVLRRVMIALAVIGLGVATYLTVVHYVGFQVLACGAGKGISSCQQVQSSVWSELAGIPVADLGLVGYVLILGSLLAPDREESRLATLGLTIVGFGFSAYLTYRELHSIHAICEWCLSSAVILTILFVCAVTRYLLGDSRPPVATDTSGVPVDGASPDRGRAAAKLAQPRA
jgi:uncharacterized membrane protein